MLSITDSTVTEGLDSPTAPACRYETVGRFKCSVLFVDDEQALTQLARGLLASDYELHIAESAEEAQLLLARNTVDIVISDQQLPGLQGIPFLEWCREHSPRSVRILMTGIYSMDEAVEAINSGLAQRFLFKPWRPEQLVALIRQAARTFLLERSHENLLDELRKLNLELEERVADRTRELEHTNRQLEQRNTILQKMALTDALTGLPNRRAMDRLAKTEVLRRARTPSHLAIALVDADNFKNINDTLGHDIGDELLRQVSRRLSDCVRLEDTIARQGGDEFIVLLDSLEDSRGASVVAQKILNALRNAFILSGTEQHVSGSVGIALYPEDGRDAQTLMKNADTAMFHGKGQGKNTYQYFTGQMNIAVKRRMTLESALRRAVMQKNFVLNYQPQIDLESGEIVAVEALVRWKTEDSGIVMPGDFIPLAEETGLINEIGEWVLREGCRQAKEWQSLGLAPRRMAINLSARQFSDRGFLDMVTRVLAETGLEPQHLELEITESQVMRQTEGMIMLLNKLSEMGVQLAIDDFGTGYSSLSYLKRLPIQKLKIDQSFVRDITVDPNDTAIVVAIINMAKSLDLETIAEGVETAGQLALLRSKGCRTGQGFYFSAPVRAEVLYPLLKQNNLYLQR